MLEAHTMRTFTFTISELHVQIIACALGKLPHEVVAATVKELQMQLNAQNQPEPPHAVSSDTAKSA